MVATLLPNGVEVFELYLAALQAGWYLVPINHHLIAPEVAYILKDSDAKAFVTHERFAEVAADAAGRAGLKHEHTFAIGAIAGFESYAAMRDAQSSRDPDDRTIGDVMNYTSGTTGNPKGVFRKLSGATPEEAALGLSGHPIPLRHPDRTTPMCTSWARRSTTRPCSATPAPPSTCSTPWC